MYESLINADIRLVFNGQAANSFKVKEIKPTTNKGENADRGFIHTCVVEWEKKTPGMSDTVEMSFDEQTLKELSENKEADCPGMPMLKYLWVK